MDPGSFRPQLRGGLVVVHRGDLEEVQSLGATMDGLGEHPMKTDDLGVETHGNP